MMLSLRDGIERNYEPVIKIKPRRYFSVNAWGYPRTSEISIPLLRQVKLHTSSWLIDSTIAPATDRVPFT